MLERQVGDREGKPDIDKVLPLFTETGLSELRQKLEGGPVFVTHNLTGRTGILREVVERDPSNPNEIRIVEKVVDALIVIVNKRATDEELAKMPKDYKGVPYRYMPYGK